MLVYADIVRVLYPRGAMQETWVRSLVREDPLEEETAPRSSTLAWRIPWMEEPGQATVHGVAKSRTRLSDFTYLQADKRFQLIYRTGKLFQAIKPYRPENNKNNVIKTQSRHKLN